MKICIIGAGRFSQHFIPLFKAHPLVSEVSLANEGSHQFLADDFVRAVAGLAEPSCGILDTARYNAPGIIAHQSSLRDGEWLPVPQFGS